MKLKESILPTGVSHLTSCLPDVDGDDFTHFGWRSVTNIILISFCSHEYQDIVLVSLWLCRRLEFASALLRLSCMRCAGDRRERLKVSNYFLPESLSGNAKSPSKTESSADEYCSEQWLTVTSRPSHHLQLITVTFSEAFVSKVDLPILYGFHLIILKMKQFIINLLVWKPRLS